MVNVKSFRKMLYLLALDYNIPADNVYFNEINESFWIDIPDYILSVQVKEIREQLELLGHNQSDEGYNGC